MGRRPAAAVGLPTASLRVSQPEAPAVVTDALGIPADGLLRRPPAATDLQFLLDLVATDCPLGPLRSRILVGGDGRVVCLSWVDPPTAEDRRDSTVERTALSITGPYLLLLAWLHREEVTFGNLLWAGAEVRGDLLDFAALDGVVSAPAGARAESAVVDALIELSARHARGPTDGSPVGGLPPE